MQKEITIEFIVSILFEIKYLKPNKIIIKKTNIISHIVIMPLKEISFFVRLNSSLSLSLLNLIIQIFSKKL